MMTQHMRGLTFGTLAVLSATAFGSICWSAGVGPDGSLDGLTESAVLSRSESTTSLMRNLRIVRVADTETIVRTYEVPDRFGNLIPHYSISQDGGKTWSRDRETSGQVLLRYAGFDPLVSTPVVNPQLRADANNRLFIVQCITLPMEVFQEKITDLGGEVLQFISNNAMIVEMDGGMKEEVGRLPFVRWVGALQPAYKADQPILDEFFPIDEDAPAETGSVNSGSENLQAKDNAQAILAANQLGEDGPKVLPKKTFTIMVFERGARQKKIVARAIRKLGGRIDNLNDHGFLLRVTFNAGHLAEVLKMNEVAFVELWGPPEMDMDIAREIGGAITLENTLGFRGEGVHAEVMDENILSTHEAFQNPPIVFHGGHGGSNWHGTSTSGIVYGDFAPNLAPATGLLSKAEMKISADFGNLTDRHAHTAELTDPNGPYRAVLQSNSWGDPRSRNYTAVSADMDDLLFLNDILITQSQSNAGNQDSRPQAWAKNIVAVGGVRHQNTLTKDDDCWCSGGSIGPAADGRIKPDLTHFYDNVFTTTNTGNSNYQSDFGGTSAATPIVAGYFGLLYQMWHEQVFTGFGGGADVFDDRPHMSTAKAIIINTAEQYPFNSPNQDLSRVKQGWGMPQLENILDDESQMLIINETDILQNMQSKSYVYQVPADHKELKVTLVYTDPAGTPLGQHARVNDLSLKVTAPDGTFYWGNNGLLDGNYSTPGGTSNTVDTVENVFVESPQQGNWTIEVFADEIVEDSHVETQAMDADYALVARYSSQPAPSCMDLVVTNLIGGRSATFTVSKNIVRGETVTIMWGLGGTPTVLNNVSGYCATFGFHIPLNNAQQRIVAQGFVDQNDQFIADRFIPGNLSGRNIMFQAAKKGTCPDECVSNLWSGQIQ